MLATTCGTCHPSQFIPSHSRLASAAEDTAMPKQQCTSDASASIERPTSQATNATCWLRQSQTELQQPALEHTSAQQQCVVQSLHECQAAVQQEAALLSCHMLGAATCWLSFAASPPHAFTDLCTTSGQRHPQTCIAPARQPQKNVTTYVHVTACWQPRQATNW